MSKSYALMVHEASATLKRICSNLPRFVVVLGSGFGDFAKRLEVEQAIEFKDIDYFKSAVVSGHTGRIVIGRFSGRRLLCVQGRLHYYEGHSMEEVTFPFRVFASSGAQSFLLTNASGSLHPEWSSGDLMLLTDHINLMGVNPLRGPNEESWGPRFLDCSEVYHRDLNDRIIQSAKRAGMVLRSGVYAALSGPTYESPAEVKMLQRLGADAIGMSTVPEALALHHSGKVVGAISCLSNLASGLSRQPLSHEEVLVVGRRSEERFANLFAEFCKTEGGYFEETQSP